MEDEKTILDKGFEEREREYLRKEDELRKAKVVTNVLANYVNHNRTTEAFKQAFKQEHRTLQQSMFKMFLELMEEMATGDYPTDARNEDSKQVAITLIKGYSEAKKQDYIKGGTSPERAAEYVLGDGAKPSRYLSFI